MLMGATSFTALQNSQWKVMQSKFIYANPVTQKNIAQVKSVIIASRAGIPLSSPTFKNILASNMRIQSGGIKQITQSYQLARDTSQALNTANVQQQQLTDTTTAYTDLMDKYNALLQNPQQAVSTDLFGGLGKYLPYVLLGIGAIIILPMLIRGGKQ